MSRRSGAQAGSAVQGLHHLRPRSPVDFWESVALYYVPGAYGPLFLAIVLLILYTPASLLGLDDMPEEVFRVVVLALFWGPILIGEVFAFRGAVYTFSHREGATRAEGQALAAGAFAMAVLLLVAVGAVLYVALAVSTVALGFPRAPWQRHPYQALLDHPMYMLCPAWVVCIIASLVGCIAFNSGCRWQRQQGED